MKTDLRYQNGFLYEHHGAWYVRYRQRISKEDGSCNLNHLSKHLGRSKDFRDISDVELRRASFMQTVNRDRLSANSRIGDQTFDLDVGSQPSKDTCQPRFWAGN